VKEDPTPLDVAVTDSPPSFPEGGLSSPPIHPEVKRRDLFKSSMLDLGGSSVIGDQSKGKEGKLFGYSVLDTYHFEFHQYFRRLDHPARRSQRQRDHSLPNCGDQPRICDVEIWL
jgi:hypothetical protein